MSGSALKTLVLVGSGALDNAWGPVTAALKSQFPSLLEGEENTAFANLVFQMRWGALALQRAGGDRDPQRLDELKTSHDQTKALYTRLKADLAKRLKDASDSGSLRPRGSAQQVFTRFCKGQDAMVITTNWDTTIEGPFPPSDQLGVQYLHGNVRQPTTLYLPTEAVDEPYRDLAVEGPYLDVVRKASLRAMDLIAKCDRLVVYGLSISPLDAELGVVLAAGAQQRKSKFVAVVVVNPDPVPVLRRLQFFLGGQNYSTLGPGDL